MSKKLAITLASVTLLLLVGIAPIVAHHAFSAEFDATKPVALRGKITKMIEAGPPGALVRRGWRKDSVIPGTEVLVEGYQAIDNAFRANGRDVTFPDGTRLFAGSSGTGAPRDGSDPTEPE